MFSENNITIRD